MSKAIKDILSNQKKFDEIARAAFDSVDIDKSGQIDEKELGKAMSNIAADLEIDPPKPEEIKEVLDHLDTDKSGQIDFKEFSVLIRDVLTAIVEES